MLGSSRSGCTGCECGLLRSEKRLLGVAISLDEDGLYHCLLFCIKSSGDGVVELRLFLLNFYWNQYIVNKLCEKTYCEVHFGKAGMVQPCQVVSQADSPHPARRQNHLLGF